MIRAKDLNGGWVYGDTLISEKALYTGNGVEEIQPKTVCEKSPFYDYRGIPLFHLDFIQTKIDDKWVNGVLTNGMYGWRILTIDVEPWDYYGKKYYPVTAIKQPIKKIGNFFDTDKITLFLNSLQDYEAGAKHLSRIQIKDPINNDATLRNIDKASYGCLIRKDVKGYIKSVIIFNVFYNIGFDEAAFVGSVSTDSGLIYIGNGAITYNDMDSDEDCWFSTDNKGWFIRCSDGTYPIYKLYYKGKHIGFEVRFYEE